MYNPFSIGGQSGFEGTLAKGEATSQKARIRGWVLNI